MMDAATIPRPGSVDARELGCTCPVIDNHHGEGATGPSGDWWYNRACLVHRDEIASRMSCAAAVGAEVALRRRHWIAGIPTPSDIDAMVSHLAHRLKLPEATIRDTLGPIAAVA